MCNFLKEDVIKVAKALTEESVFYMGCDHLPFFYCEYCDASLSSFNASEKDFKHDLDCPVLVAQDLLTEV